MNITNWSKAIETLSEKMPDPVTIIKASEHTLRMLHHNTFGQFDQETDKARLGEGVRGYLWRITIKVNPELKHGIFEYLQGGARKATLDFSIYPDGAYTPEAIIKA